MRRIIVGLTGVTALTLTVFAYNSFGPTPVVALADGVLRYGPDCSFAADIDRFSFNFCFEDVATPSGNAIAHFQGDLISDPPDRATTVRGFPCAASFPSYEAMTTDTRMVVMPDGRVNGTCKFHPE